MMGARRAFCWRAHPVVFDRYHIVSPGDLQDMARKLAGASAAAGTFAGTSAVSRIDRAAEVRENPSSGG